ncbi:hypothetical protein [Arthrobacter sp. NPDC089319]
MTDNHGLATSSPVLMVRKLLRKPSYTIKPAEAAHMHTEASGERTGAA